MIGKVVRVSFYIKTEGADPGGAGFGAATRSVAGKPPCDSPVLAGFGSGIWKGTSDWTRYKGLPVEIGCHAEALEFGVGLRGAGTAWIDDVTVEIEDETLEIENEVPSPEQAHQALPGTQNLDFEQ